MNDVPKKNYDEMNNKIDEKIWKSIYIILNFENFNL